PGGVGGGGEGGGGRGERVEALVRQAEVAEGRRPCARSTRPCRRAVHPFLTVPSMKRGLRHAVACRRPRVCPVGLSDRGDDSISPLHRSSLLSRSFVSTLRSPLHPRGRVHASPDTDD